MNTESALLITVQKIRLSEVKVSEDNGDFYLFGLFERESTPGRFDLIASAPWLKADLSGTNQLIELMQPYLSIEDWRVISAVFLFEPSTDYVQWFTQRYYIVHQIEETHNALFNGVPVSRAFLITVNPSPAQVNSQLVAA